MKDVSSNSGSTDSNMENSYKKVREFDNGVLKRAFKKVKDRRSNISTTLKEIQKNFNNPAISLNSNPSSIKDVRKNASKDTIGGCQFNSLFLK